MSTSGASAPNAGAHSAQPAQSRVMRRSITVGAIFMVVIGLVLLYLLTQATNNREM
jgi:hypothetical protein